MSSLRGTFQYSRSYDGRNGFKFKNTLTRLKSEPDDDRQVVEGAIYIYAPKSPEGTWNFDRDRGTLVLERADRKILDIVTATTTINYKEKNLYLSKNSYHDGNRLDFVVFDGDKLIYSSNSILA